MGGKKGKRSKLTNQVAWTHKAEKQKCSHLDLFVGGDGTKDDLCEALRRKHPEADPSDHAAILDQ